MNKDLDSPSKKEIFEQAKRMLEFPRIDELMGEYVIFERAYV